MAESLYDLPRMNPGFYWFGRHFFRFARTQCLNIRKMNMDRLERSDPFLIACTHVSHLEPALLSSMMDRPVHWIARQEYYRGPLFGYVLRWAGAISIQRTGQPPVKAIRTAIKCLGQNRLVGIFPEGGVHRGKECIFRGGVNRLGAVLIAQRAQVPIVPVVMLGTDKLNIPEPWLPGRQAGLWVNVGEPVLPAPITRATRRPLRIETGRALQQRFVDTYQELLKNFNLSDSKVP